MKVLLAANINSAHTIKWVRSLHQAGVEIVIFSLTERAPGNTSLPADIKVYTAGFPSALHSRESKMQKLKFFLMPMRLKKILSQEAPDILHAHYASSYGHICTRTGFHPTLVSVWGSDVFDFPRSNGIAKRMIKATFLNADRILSTSQAMADEVKKYSEKAVLITPFGVDTDLFRNTGKRIYFSSDDIVLGCVKSLEPVYGHEFLLKAFKRLKNELPEHSLKLLLVGDGSLRDQLQEWLAEMGLSESVIFAGHVPQQELPDHFSSMDIYVNPSRAESFGVSALEAASCHLPVVASRVGGLPEVVKHEETGYLFYPENEDGFIAAVRSLVLQPDTRIRFGEQGRAMVIANYEMKQCVKTMKDIYRDVLNKTKKQKNQNNEQKIKSHQGQRDGDLDDLH